MTLVENVGWVLLHFIWQGAAVAAALWIVTALMPSARATTRYALGCGALLLMLMTPIVTAVRTTTDRSSAVREDRVAAVSDSRSPLATPRAALATTPAPAPAAHAEDSTPARASAPSGEASMASMRALVDRSLPWLVVCWAAGVVLLSIRLVGGWWRTRALRTSGVSPVPTACQELLVRLMARMRLTRPVVLAASVRVSVPVVLGHTKPLVLLPVAALAGLSLEQLEAIIAHELAHVRRHDYLVNLAQTVVETVLFYHPAVWWVSRQIRVAREHCCDDLAVEACGDRKGYVLALLRLEQLRQPVALLALGVTDGPLLARARRVLSSTQSQPASPRLAASAIALTIAGLAIAGVSTASEEPALAETWRIEGSSPRANGDPEPDGVEALTAQYDDGVRVPVIAAPEPGAALATRWSWGERESRTRKARHYWLAYTVTPAKALPPLLYLDRNRSIVGERVSFNGHFIGSRAVGLRFPGRRLEVPAADEHAIKLLFAFDTSGGTPKLTKVHGSTLPLPVDVSEWPVFWLGAADAAQSLELVEGLYGRASNAELKHDLIVAAGVHHDSPAVVSWLERRVSGSDGAELRAEAAEWMAWHPISAALTALDRAARTDRASRVRQEAAEALGDLAMPQATPTLIALARTLDDLDARREAVEALGARPELEARDALGAIAREDSHLDIQREAVETLGDYEDQRGVPMLLDLARTHPNGQVRREAVETLGDALPKETAAQVLKQLALDDADPGVQEEAVDTLADVDDQSSLTTLMELAQSHPRSEARRGAVEALAHRMPSEHENTADDAKDVAAIVDLLGKLSENDRDMTVQLEAIETLGEISDAKSIERLRTLATTHAKPEVRREAIEAIVEHAKAADAVALLRQVVQKDPDQSVRLDAVERLAEVQDPEARAALSDLAKSHKDENVRAEAVESLGHAAPAADAANVLKAIALADPAGRVRSEAVETLSELPDRAGLPALMELARTHQDESARAEAVESLGQAGPAGEVAEALKGIALRDASPRVRDEAMDTLTELPDGAGVAALIELARTHPDAEMRKHALEALVESDHPRAREVFERALRR